MNQRKQKRENITGIRPETKETKSQRKQRKRLELEYEKSQRSSKQHETQCKAHKQAQKKNPKKEQKQAKRRHRASKNEARRKRQPELVSSALEKNVQRWFISGKGYKLPNVFLNDTKDGVKKLVNTMLIGPKKVYTILKCILVKHNLKTGEKIYADFIGRSKTHIIMTKLGDTYEEIKGKTLESLSKFQKEGSGWQLHSIVGLYIIIVKFKPLSQ